MTMGIMNRPAGMPRKPMPRTAAPLPEAIGDELCDHCGAAARHQVRVVYTTVHGTRRLGELLFCEHHYCGHLPSLIAQGLRAA
jgi:hypothetical protein